MSKYKWVAFWSVQLVGSWIGMGASHVEHFSWNLSLLMLMPGAFVSSPFFTPGSIGNTWPKWTIFAIAVGANLVFLELWLILRRIYHHRKAGG